MTGFRKQPYDSIKHIKIFNAKKVFCIVCSYNMFPNESGHVYCYLSTFVFLRFGCLGIIFFALFSVWEFFLNFFYQNITYLKFLDLFSEEWDYILKMEQSEEN